MPLLVRWPGRIEAGTVYPQLVQNIDDAPTLLDACGVEVPRTCTGSSLMRVIQDGTDMKRRYDTARLRLEIPDAYGPGGTFDPFQGSCVWAGVGKTGVTARGRGGITLRYDGI